MSDKVFTVEVILSGVGKGIVWAGCVFAVLFFVTQCSLYVWGDETQPTDVRSISDPSLNQAIIFGMDSKREVIVVPYKPEQTFDNQKYLQMLQDLINQRMEEYPEHAHHYLEAQRRVEEGLSE